MAWVKIPAENHSVYRAALPKDPRLSTVAMFGGLCTLVNGNMAAGLWARSAFVTLDEAGQHEALALDGAEPFDPMGRGKPFSGRIVLPETILDEPGELRAWLQRAVDHVATLPPKKKKTPKARATAKATATPKANAAGTRARKTATAKKPAAARPRAAAASRGVRRRPAAGRASRR